MLEKLVHANTVMPANQHYIRITIPNGVSYEVFPPAKFSGWDGKREDICKTFGEAWFAAGRSALLLVPSIPARVESNILTHPAPTYAQAISFDPPDPHWRQYRLHS